MEDTSEILAHDRSLADDHSCVKSGPSMWVRLCFVLGYLLVAAAAASQTSRHELLRKQREEKQNEASAQKGSRFM